MSLAAGIFTAMHGLVHMWYVTLSQGWVEFQPDMGWSGNSWLLTGLIGEGPTRVIASGLYTSAAIALVASGISLLGGADWAKPLLAASAGLSTAVILIFWDGDPEMMVQKGILGILINLAILAVAIGR